jgi:hypothetical protein
MSVYFEAAAAWGRQLLRRPQTIAPFVVEQGARMEVDPATPTRATVTGGGVRLKPETVVQAQGSRVVFRTARLRPISGEFTCLCTSDQGGCKVEIIDSANAIVCRPDSGCKTCEMSVVIRPNLAFAAEVFRT